MDERKTLDDYCALCPDYTMQIEYRSPCARVWQLEGKDGLEERER